MSTINYHRRNLERDACNVKARGSLLPRAVLNTVEQNQSKANNTVRYDLLRGFVGQKLSQSDLEPESLKESNLHHPAVSTLFKLFPLQIFFRIILEGVGFADQITWLPD